MPDQPAAISDRIIALPGGEHLRRCYACGTCVSRCLVPDRLDPAFNPRRLIKKAVLDLSPEVLEDITPWLCSACDRCHVACPQKIHISRVLAAVRRVAAEAGRTPIVLPAMVDGRSCTACGLCIAACPYKAIELQEVKVLDQKKIIAQVDARACMACGLCGALCRSSAIGPDGDFSDAAVLAEIIDWLAASKP